MVYICSNADASLVVRASSPNDAAEIFINWVANVDYTATNRTNHVEVMVRQMGGRGHKETVSIHPETPHCTEPDHEWIHVHEEEANDIARFVHRCRRCGLVQINVYDSSGGDDRAIVTIEYRI